MNINQENLNQDLLKAVHCDDIMPAQKLLAAGADPNCKDDKGKTPLAAAVRYQRRRMALLLLANGANCNCEAYSDGGPDYTTLMEAAHQGDLRTVQALLAGGAKIDHQSSTGLTPVMCAVQKAWGSRKAGCLVIIKVLLAIGADPNRHAKEGMTALMMAAASGCPEAVEILLAHGAHLDNKDDIGMTAYTHAVFNGHQEVADLLVKHGADPSLFTPSPSEAGPGANQPEQNQI
jgi:uncharacterized protein